MNKNNGNKHLKVSDIKSLTITYDMIIISVLTFKNHNSYNE